jgi:hypothetical protein
MSFLFVASERVGQRARQRTLLNLGRRFDLPQIDWSLLCTCLDSVRTTGLCRQRWASSTDCRENPHCNVSLVTLKLVISCALANDCLCC